MASARKLDSDTIRQRTEALGKLLYGKPSKPRRAKVGRPVSAARSAMAQKPKPVHNKTANTSSVLDRVRESITVIEGSTQELDWPSIEIRLKICERCDTLSDDGCGGCATCASRWIKWKEWLIQGGCAQFDKSENAELFSRKVEGMLLYNFQVVVEVPTTDDPSKRVKQPLRIVCEDDVADVARTAAEVMPGCRVTADIRKGLPVDGITSKIKTEPIEVNPDKGPQRPAGMMPHGPMMMHNAGPMPTQVQQHIAQQQ